MPRPSLDRDKIRAHIRKLDTTALYVLLDRAIELLPKTKLPKLLEGYAHLDALEEEGPRASLQQRVHLFHAAALRGDYYQGFKVNSQNCMTKSKGTSRFIADFRGLLDECTSASRKKQHRSLITEAFELLFHLLVEINECREDIVFFADEGGAWQVGVDWQVVLPAYARCLSDRHPDEYAAKIAFVVRNLLYTHDRAAILPVIRKTATKARRTALAKALR